VLDTPPLSADPLLGEVVDDDGVRPVDDVVVECRLAPVDGGARLSALGAHLVEAGYEVRVLRGIRQGGSDALALLSRYLVAAGGEAVIAEVGEHPQIVVLGDRVAGEKEDVHRQHPGRRQRWLSKP
jgi:hypothetical protein